MGIRILMALLTRPRATPGDHIPSDMMVKYYSDRASSGLIITECSMITPLTTRNLVTDAVHAKGGKIFCQIWHVGRAAHPDLNDDAEPVALPLVSEITDIVQLHATAAANCVVKIAGFDGVEIHSANGFLIDQFLRDGSNYRSDNYGGSHENRARLLREVVTAVTNAIGSDRVAVHVSPLNSYELAYVHVFRADFYGLQTGDVVSVTLIANAGYSTAEAEEAIASGKVERFEKDAPLNSADSSLFYTGGEKGYNDYPFLNQSQEIHET
ncbi:hypothetical protein THRCLA_08117 [Thraustotheca clavata]|uniref:NADH:flavin oxidoreductase/NADH oxidase N-terminal domain-containing protein n=1 Tax=Thraustotheca clavata TaxID=74557 RepID=A0A1V9Z9T0_9STRA|nr:hypothetical protein THRCLA_08117 [Thraustotheca clavata]